MYAWSGCWVPRRCVRRLACETSELPPSRRRACVFCALVLWAICQLVSCAFAKRNTACTMANSAPTALAAVMDLPSHADIQATVPTGWREQFIAKHADAAVYTSLLSVSRTTRNWALQTAPKLTIQLQGPVPGARAAAVMQALATRGDRPTTLRLIISLGTVPSIDSISGAGISELQIVSTGCLIVSTGVDAALSACLQHAVSAFPYLTALHLDRPCILPAPKHLPRLTRLHAVVPDHAGEPAAHINSIAPYTVQLTSLSVQCGWPFVGERLGMYPESYWAEVLPHTTHTLTELSTNWPLSDALISAVLGHAPALRQIAVDKISCRWDGESDVTHTATKGWGVECITVRGKVDLNALALLPARVGSGLGSNGVSLLKARTCELLVKSEQGLDSRLVSRWPEYQIQAQTIEIRATDSLARFEHAVVLKNVMTQISGLQAPGAIIALRDWRWSDDTLETTAAALRLLPNHRFTLDLSHHNRSLSSLLQMPPNVCRLKLYELSVTDDVQPDAPWPWEQLEAQYVDMAALTSTPDPASWQGDGRPVIVFKSLDVSTVKQAQVAELTRRLAHLHWQPADQSETTVTITAPGFTQPEQGAQATHVPDQASLATQLSVLRSLTITQSQQSRPVTVKARSSLTVDAMQALAGLPEWAMRLVFDSCAWPLPDAEYAQLAQYVPTSYTAWHLGNIPRASLLQCVCDGINQRRVGLGLRAVEVKYEGAGRGVKPGECVSLVYEFADSEDEDPPHWR